MEDRAMSHRKETEAMASQPIEDWASIPWRKLARKVYRLQKQIYRASERGNDKAVHNLQRLLMKSQAARTLAVRKVTQDNQGKRTAGIDGVKSVEPHNVLSWSNACATTRPSNHNRPEGSGYPSQERRRKGR